MKSAHVKRLDDKGRALFGWKKRGLLKLVTFALFVVGIVALGILLTIFPKHRSFFSVVVFPYLLEVFRLSLIGRRGLDVGVE